MGIVRGGGGSDVGDLGSYKFKVGDNGELQLVKPNVTRGVDDVVSSFSPDGSYFKTSVSTGVGSYHLGGSDSGGVSHTMSAMGQNVGFKNEWTTVVDNDKIVWFPTWQGIAVDGGELKYASKLNFTAPEEVLPVGVSYMSTVGVDYDFGVAITEDMAVLGLTVYNKEFYTGKLYNVIYHGTSGSEIYRTELHTDELAVDWSQWQTETFIKYKYPYFARNGDQLRVAILKEDGTPLKVAPSTQNPSIPWRRLKVSKFTDDYLIGDSESFNFDVKSTTSTQTRNGVVALNNWTVASMKTITVAPNVDYLRLIPWDAAQSTSEYSAVKLPLDANGSSYITVNYMTNNPVEIFRHAASSTDPYDWYAIYEGFPSHRVTLPTTANGTFDLRAGLSEFEVAITMLNVSAATTAIDDKLSLYADKESSDITVHSMYLKTSSSTSRGVRTVSHYGDSASNFVARFVSINSSSTTAVPMALNCANSDGFFTTIEYGYTDGSGEAMRRYELSAYRSNDVLRIKVKRWINPNFQTS